MARKTFDICLGPFLKNLKGVIPYYQRQYVWNKKQIQSLIDTINSAMDMKTPEYIGVLGVFKEKHVDNIIDGQQRLTSFMVLFSAMRHVMMQRKEEYLKEYIDDIANQIIGTERKLSPYTLVQDNSFNEYYKMLIQNQKSEESKIIGDKISCDNLKKNFDFLVKYFSELTSEKLIKFYDTAIGNIELTCSEFDDYDEAIKYFVNINKAGVPLTESQLVKYHLVKKAKDKSDINNKWNFLLNAVGYQNIDRYILYLCQGVYSTEVTNKTVYSYCSTKNPEELLSKLLFYIDIFNNTNAEKEYYPVFSYFKTVRFNQHIPFIIALFEKNLSDTEIKEISLMLFSYLFKRSLVAGQQNVTESAFKSVIKYMHKKDMVTATEIKNKLREIVSPLISSNEVIKSVLGGNVIYKNKQRIMLTVIENNSLKETQLISSSNLVNLEHIIPREYNESYNIDKNEYDNIVSSLGNLTLLNHSINKSIKNADWITKKESYKNSSVSLTKDLLKYDVFSKKEVINRGKEIIDTCLSILDAYEQ